MLDDKKEEKKKKKYKVIKHKGKKQSQLDPVEVALMLGADKICKIKSNSPFHPAVKVGKEYNLKEVSLDEITSLKIKDKEYLIKYNGGPFVSAKLICKASDQDTIYVCHEMIKGDGESKVCLDEDYLPYYEKTIGTVTFKVYEEIFWRNRGFSSAMGRVSQGYRAELFDGLKQESHPLYHQFKDHLENIIDKAPQIKQAKDKEFYLGDKKALSGYSEQEIEVWKILTRTEYPVSHNSDDFEVYDYLDYVGGKYNPDYHNADDIFLSEQPEIYPRSAYDKETTAFIRWYYHYLESKDYMDKTEDPIAKRKQAFKQHLNNIAEDLEAKGFRRSGR